MRDVPNVGGDSFQKSVELYKLTEGMDSKLLKGSDSHDRRVLEIAYKNITQRNSETNQHVISDEDFKKTYQHLSNLKSGPELSIFQNISRAIGNFFGRISSEKLSLEKKDVENALAADRKEFDEIPGKILKKKEDLAEWKEMVRFNQADALPLYKDILNFFSELPLDQRDAQGLINLKLKETQQQVEKAKTEGNEPSYMKILEKEILANFAKLAK